MTAVIDALLAIAVAAACLGALALVRLRPLLRVHAVTFLNVAGGGAVTLAAWATEGPTPRTVKILLIWVIMLLSGSLSAQVVGRAIHLRSGQRR